MNPILTGFGMTRVHYRRVFGPIWRYSTDNGQPYTDRVCGGHHLFKGYYFRWSRPMVNIGPVHMHDRIETL